MLNLRSIALAAALMSVSACDAATGLVNAVRPEPERAIPVARWDHKPQAEAWTGAVLGALEGPGAPLVDLVPADFETWCPGYATATEEERKAFWVGLLSALAKHESTWRPEVSGGGGRWHGLLQISPGTARGYGCRAQTAAALKDGVANLQCAVRIMGRTVTRDRVIAAGGRGVAADWGPFHFGAKRADMQAWTRVQPYCVAE